MSRGDLQTKEALAQGTAGSLHRHRPACAYSVVFSRVLELVLAIGMTFI